MKALALHSFDYKSLATLDLPDPVPGHGQVLLKMRAASLNFRDSLIARGAYNPKQELPLVPLSDGVGVVVATGEGTHGWEPGDRACPLFATGWLSGIAPAGVAQNTLGSPRPGTLSELFLAEADSLVRVPEYLSDVEAATLPCAAVTAWNALVTEGQVQPGQRVLVQGSGGVSLFALAFARLAGAQVIATSSQPAKLERLKSLGAIHGINSVETPNWGDVIRRDFGGVDHVIEVGGAGTLGQSIRACRPGGRISVIGVLSGFSDAVDIRPILMNHLRLQGIFVGGKDVFESMLRAMVAHKMRPEIDSIHEAWDAVSAFEILASGRQFGKICLRF